MKRKTERLKAKLIEAEINYDKSDIVAAYLTLRRAVLDYLDISMQDINEAVLEQEAKSAANK